MSTIKLHFLDASRNLIKTVDAQIGLSILEVTRKHSELNLEGACEGSLACSTCHVILDAEFYEQMPTPSDEEEDMLDLAFGLTATSRLGCQIILAPEHDGMNIIVPKESRNIMLL